MITNTTSFSTNLEKPKNSDMGTSVASSGTNFGSEIEDEVSSQIESSELSETQIGIKTDKDLRNEQFGKPQLDFHSDSYLIDKIRIKIAKIIPLLVSWKESAQTPDALAPISEINSIIDSCWEMIPANESLIGTTLSAIQDSISVLNSWKKFGPDQIDAISSIVEYIVENRKANYYSFAQKKFSESKIRTLPQVKDKSKDATK